jgi:DNA repair protein RecN (Recombination protein N)
LIETLRVRNLVTIDSLELELGPGLTVVTGETGAGKSVLLGAIALLSGQRVGTELVRAGAADASVEATLRSTSLPARARALGLADDGDEPLLVSRTLAREGRSRVFVNGKLATVALLAELVGEELEITSQGEHQRLLRPEAQAELLDAYAGSGAAREVAALTRAFASSRPRSRRAGATARLARREDQLRFEIEQIEAAPRVGELEELAEHSRLATSIGSPRRWPPRSNTSTATTGCARLGAARGALRGHTPRLRARRARGRARTRPARARRGVARALALRRAPRGRSGATRAGGAAARRAAPAAVALRRDPRGRDRAPRARE